MLVDKIVRLQRQIAKKQEKLDFVEEHMSTMTDELKKKNRIIQGYVMNQESGTLSTENMDENKVIEERLLWRFFVTLIDMKLEWWSWS